MPLKAKKSFLLSSKLLPGNKLPPSSVPVPRISTGSMILPEQLRASLSSLSSLHLMMVTSTNYSQSMKNSLQETLLDLKQLKDSLETQEILRQPNESENRSDRKESRLRLKLRLERLNVLLRQDARLRKREQSKRERREKPLRKLQDSRQRQRPKQPELRQRQRLRLLELQLLKQQRKRGRDWLKLLERRRRRESLQDLSGGRTMPSSLK